MKPSLSFTRPKCFTLWTFRYKEIDRKQKQIDAKKLEIQQTQHDVKEKRKESSDVDHRLRKLASEHLWISKDRAHFGEANTDYDFSRNDPNEVAKKVTDLSAQKEKMGKTVNARAHTQANHVSPIRLLVKREPQFADSRCSRFWTFSALIVHETFFLSKTANVREINSKARLHDL